MSLSQFDFLPRFSIFILEIVHISAFLFSALLSEALSSLSTMMLKEMPEWRKQNKVIRGTLVNTFRGKTDNQNYNVAEKRRKFLSKGKEALKGSRECFA